MVDYLDLDRVQSDIDDGLSAERRARKSLAEEHRSIFTELWDTIEDLKARVRELELKKEVSE